MVKTGLLSAVLLVGALLSVAAMYAVTPGEAGSSTFVGVCVKTGEGYAILFNGTSTILVPKPLETGKVYAVEGEIEERNGLQRISGRYRIREARSAPFPTETLQGAYWIRKGKPYLLTPDWVELSRPLDAPKGSRVKASGLRYGSKFYPVEYSVIENASGEFDDGMPAKIRGVVLGHFGSKNRIVVWNGSERLYVYLPYGQTVSVGKAVEILGRVSITSRINVYVDSRGDVRVRGYPTSVPINESSTGEIGEGTCTVVRVEKSGLSLDCTDLKLKGVQARAGDVLRVKALNTGSYLRCIQCGIVKDRKELPNGICNPAKGRFSRIQGKVEWVKTYRNGFGIANVTNGPCWVLLKLPKSLGVSLSEGERVTAYGFFTTYRGERAFEVGSGDDVCSGNC